MLRVIQFVILPRLYRCSVYGGSTLCAAIVNAGQCFEIGLKASLFLETFTQVMDAGKNENFLAKRWRVKRGEKICWLYSRKESAPQYHHDTQRKTRNNFFYGNTHNRVLNIHGCLLVNVRWFWFFFLFFYIAILLRLARSTLWSACKFEWVNSNKNKK